MREDSVFRSDGEGGGGDGYGVHWQQVPPPRKAPHFPQSEELGVLPCLQTEKSRHGGWRCGHCHEMQPEESWQVWVPDWTRITESEASITEAARQGAFNGGSTGWCLSCAKRLGHPIRAIIPSSNDPFGLVLMMILLMGGLSAAVVLMIVAFTP